MEEDPLPSPCIVRSSLLRVNDYRTRKVLVAQSGAPLMLVIASADIPADCSGSNSLHIVMQSRTIDWREGHDRIIGSTGYE